MFKPETLPQNAEAAKDVTSVIASGGDCTMELKLDGIRLMAWVTADANGERRTRTFTRTGKEQTGKLPAIEAELAANLPADTWVDGEVVAIQMRADGSVEHHWGTAQSVMGAGVEKAAKRSKDVTYSIFDVMSIGGTDARSLPLARRRHLLEMAFAQGTYAACILTPQMEPTEENLASILAAGFEGAMIKRLALPYASGKRGAGWHKIKHTDTVDAIITGYQPGEGKYLNQLGALLLSQIDADGNVVQIAKCSGMTDALRKEMSENPETYIGQVIEFRHMGQMPTGGYRHPVFMRLRSDKAATECVAS